MCCRCFDSELLELKYAYEKMIKNINSVSENDVQANLVEPILKLIGIPTYDIEVLKRANRNKKDSKPDIIVKLQDRDILIEVKSLKSTEFNVDKVYKNNNKVGALKLKSSKNKDQKNSEPENSKSVDQENKGPEVSNNKDKTDEEPNSWENNPGDEVGQIRLYWLKYKENNNKIKIPILTNGERWVIFNFYNKDEPQPIKKKMFYLIFQ